MPRGILKAVSVWASVLRLGCGSCAVVIPELTDCQRVGCFQTRQPRWPGSLPGQSLS